MVAVFSEKMALPGHEFRFDDQCLVFNAFMLLELSHFGSAVQVAMKVERLVADTGGLRICNCQ